MSHCINNNPCCKHSIEKEYERGHIVIYCRLDDNTDCPYNVKYSFPYNVNPDCLECENLNIDYEEDNIKKWCDADKCHLLKTYIKRDV